MTSPSPIALKHAALLLDGGYAHPSDAIQAAIDEVADARLKFREHRRAGLTAVQRDCLVFMERYSAKNDGVMPSYDEMAKALGLASKSGVARIIGMLEQRGHVERHAGQGARSIALVSA